MRIFQLLLFAFVMTHACGQQRKPGVDSTPVCTIRLNCVSTVGSYGLNPFNTSGPYTGTVIIVATLNTFTMQLIKYKLVFADLHLKTDTTKKIEVRWRDRSGDVEYLDALLPELIDYLKGVKFRLVTHKGCVMTTVWNFPINID